MLLSQEEKAIQQKNIQNLYSLLQKSKTVLSPDQALRYYFEQIVSYYPVSNPHVAKYLNINSVENMSDRKVFALKHALSLVEDKIYKNTLLHDLPLSIGFSDDSLSNILAMKKSFEELRKKKTTRKYYFHLYYTGKKENYPILMKESPNFHERENMLVIKI